MTNIIIQFNSPEELSQLSDENKAVLKRLKNITAKGVYLITIDDKKYVGSAYGKSGFYERWHDYISYFKPDSLAIKDSKASKQKIGAELRQYYKGNFQTISFKVLETIIERESYHKDIENSKYPNGLNKN